MSVLDSKQLAIACMKFPDKIYNLINKKILNDWYFSQNYSFNKYIFSTVGKLILAILL